MGRKISLNFLVIIGMIVCMSEGAMARRQAAPGSFLVSRVNNVDALVKQIAANPLVAKRYAQHFGIPAADLIPYLKSNVKIVTLTKPLKTTSYYIKSGGGVTSKKRLYPAGTTMFATLSGKPIMDVRCGNPVTKALPLPAHAAIPETPVKPPTIKVEGVPAEVVIPPATASLPVTVPMQSAIEPVTTAVSAAPVTVSPFLQTTARSIAPVLLGAVVASSSVPQPVPEPGAVLAACSVLVPAAFVFRRKRR